MSARTISVFILAVFISAFLAFIALSIHRQDEQKNASNSKEWSVNHPKAKDPDVFPSPDETSVNIETLRKADSLREIYALASDMHVGSISDQKALSAIADEHLKKCCPTYERVLNDLDDAGFEEVRDITSDAIRNPQAYNVEGVDFDTAIYSEQRTSISILSIPPSVKFYKIYIFFDAGKIVKTSAFIFEEGLF